MLFEEFEKDGDMTVEQLIECLKGYPSDLEVFIPVWNGPDWGVEDEKVVETQRVDSIYKIWPDYILLKAQGQ